MTSLPKILKHDFAIPKKDSASQSIVIFLTNVPLVLKLSPSSTTRDNSLLVEREIYNKIRTTLSLESPHFLIPEEVGWGKQNTILKMKHSKKPNHVTLYKAWITLRADIITKNLRETGQWYEFEKTLTSKQQKSKMALAEHLLKHPSFSGKYTVVHYVVTPKMKGTTLSDFLNNKHVNSSDLQDVMIQIAQALTVLARHKITHHDLHDGNVFVEYFTQIQHIVYSYPKKATLLTHYVAKIYDWDHASLPEMKNTKLDGEFCRAVGECNKYVPKFDWYTVLTNVILSRKEFTREFIRIMGNLYDEKDGIGHDAWTGHPCTCRKINPNTSQCKRCVAKKLGKLCTPRQYFLATLKTR